MYPMLDDVVLPFVDLDLVQAHFYLSALDAGSIHQIHSSSGILGQREAHSAVAL